MQAIGKADLNDDYSRYRGVIKPYQDVYRDDIPTALLNHDYSIVVP